MSGIREHGLHRYTLSIPAASAGSANDTVGAQWTFDSFANGNATAKGILGLDLASYQVVEANFATYAVLTGQATNFVSPRLTHVDSTGTTRNQISVAFSSTGVVTVALAPCNLAVASAGTVTGAGTGILALGTGAVLPWTLLPGDSVVWDRVSNNATGLATPAMSVTFAIAQKGA